MANQFSRQPLIRNLLEAMQRGLEWWLYEMGEILHLLTRFKKQNRVEFGVSSADQPVLLHDGKKCYQGARKNVLLQLDDQVFLFRRIKLPAAARKNIDRVIGYEFNKYFPMEAKHALYSCKVEAPAAGATSIEIEIWAINRNLVDMYLSMIERQFELKARRLSITNREGRQLITRDIEKERRLEAANAKASIGRALNIAIAGLLLVLIVYPVKRMDAYLEQQQLEIGRLEKQVQPIIELRQKITALNERFDQLAASKREAPSQVSIWSHLTSSMGGRAILDRFEINGRNVRVSGKATSVEALLRSLESDQRIVDVKINGPVKATGDGRHETMNLSLTVRE